LAVLLLAQAGVPFTTGFLAKFSVVAASVDAHSYVLAAIAMGSAAIAAFFYLRVVVTMYSPVGAVGDLSDADATALSAGTAEGPAPAAGSTSVGATRDAAPADTVASLSVLTEAPPETSVAERVVAVPRLTVVAIGLCVAFTVVFGIIPGPVVDFAHQATLLFP
jgi:NADH-quinone oxidoreductase subunit N